MTPKFWRGECGGVKEKAGRGSAGVGGTARKKNQYLK